MQKELICLLLCSLQLINIQLGGLRVYVMDGCRWGVWQLINALIISSEDLPLLPELTEWAVCGLTSNAMFGACPLLSAPPGSHSFSSQRKICSFLVMKQCSGMFWPLELPHVWRRLWFAVCMQKWSCSGSQKYDNFNLKLNWIYYFCILEIVGSDHN